MPRKLPTTGLIQFGKQLDMFEDAAVEVGKLGTLDLKAPSHALAHANMQQEKKKVLDLFDKKGK